MNQAKVRIELGEPVVIAQATPDIRGWGFYQFPEIERTGSGLLHAKYHVEPDSARAYGKDKKHVLSRDDGQTWQHVEQDPLDGGILLANGDRLRIKHLPSIEASQLVLPEQPLCEMISYGNIYRVYGSENLPDSSKGWPLERLPAGGSSWQIEMKTVDYPGEVRYVAEGVMPRQMFWRMRLAPDKTIWAISYPFAMTGERVFCRPLFFTSRDNGLTFQYLSNIPYQPLPAIDPQYDLRGGFTEPDITFLPDGSIFCLLRTTDGHGIGPMYQCRSLDGGKTWSKPAFFDTLGVWPTLLTLANGVTLASYGRMGLFLRATASPSGADWDDRVTIVTPLAYQTDTCSYSDMVALDGQSAYLIYSDFNYPNAEGVAVKSILGRKVITEIVG